jgi:hypothetical protein
MDANCLYSSFVAVNSHAVHTRERFRLRYVEDGAREPRVGLGRPRSVPQKGQCGVLEQTRDTFSLFLFWLM